MAQASHKKFGAGQQDQDGSETMSNKHPEACRQTEAESDCRTAFDAAITRTRRAAAG